MTVGLPGSVLVRPDASTPVVGLSETPAVLRHVRLRWRQSPRLDDRGRRDVCPRGQLSLNIEVLRQATRRIPRYRGRPVTRPRHVWSIFGDLVIRGPGLGVLPVASSSTTPTHQGYRSPTPRAPGHRSTVDRRDCIGEARPSAPTNRPAGNRRHHAPIPCAVDIDAGRGHDDGRGDRLRSPKSVDVDQRVAVKLVPGGRLTDCSLRVDGVGWEQVQRGVDLPFDPRITIPHCTRSSSTCRHLPRSPTSRPPPERRSSNGSVRRSLRHDRRRRRWQPRPEQARRADAGRDRRTAATWRRAVRRAGDGQPWRGHRRGPVEDAPLARHHRGVGRCRVRATMENEIIATTASGMTVHLDHQRCRRRPDPPRQPHQAPHVLQGSDRVGLHEDGRRRLRQATGRGSDPLVRPDRDARPPARRHRRARRRPGVCSAASGRSSRAAATS